MKTQIIYAIIVILFFAACKSAEEKKMEQLNRLVKSQVLLDAAKNNLKSDSVEILNLTYSMVGQNTLDTIKRLYYAKRIGLYKRAFDASVQMAKAGAEFEKWTSGITQKGVLDAEGHNSKDYVEIARHYNDTMQYYGKLDSAVMKQIAERKNDEKVFYKTRFISKSTTAQQTKLDTLHYIFDKDFKPVDISERALIGEILI